MIDKVSEALRLQPVVTCSFEISARVRRNAAIGAQSSRAKRPGSWVRACRRSGV